MKFSVVITTIYPPVILESLSRNISIYDRIGDVEVIVIGDKKTPPDVKGYVSQFSNRGFRFEYWNVEDQKKWLTRFPDLAEIIPYNSDNRRNIGHLIAYERGRECILALDDDNYPTDADFFAGHEVVGTHQSMPTVKSSSGWFNACAMLDFEPQAQVYPRGYPYNRRWVSNEEYQYFESAGRVVVNAGLWLGDPDVDAVTRLNHPLNATALNRDSLMLDASTNCPFNTQNTAFHRDILPAYYYTYMGEDLGGLRIDRYGDIWSSYFARKVIDRMNDRVSFGLPLSNHQRHQHDLLKDLGVEYWGMLLTNDLVGILSGITLTETGYGNCYRELSIKLQDLVSESDFSDKIKQYFFKVCNNMRVWVDVCSDLESGRSQKSL